MKLTEVRVKIMDDPHDRLQAFCSITFDGCFVIRDLKIIQGTQRSFVAMPSRKLMDRCPKCHTKNHLRAAYCNQCGAQLIDDRAIKDTGGRAKLYADIAHPINSDCRNMIQKMVLQAYAEELELAKQPNYVCRYDDYDEESLATLRLDESHDTEPFAPREVPASVSATAPDADVSIRSSTGTSHRVESSSEQTLAGPHHRSATSRVGQREQTVSTREDDGFGAGII